jgi:5'-nucleotidase
MHSRIDPFPEGSGSKTGRGGMARRAALVKKIREEEEHVLLLDAGDIFQGTPYFNYFKGDLEIELMSRIKYDAATLGNHDFDAGIDKLAEHIGTNASFPFIISNYDFSYTPVNGMTKKHLILERGDIRIGITGVGIELQGIVPRDLFKNTHYIQPINAANKEAQFLKREANCDLVICLSHLGFDYWSPRKVSDIKLATYSSDIDIILGGHSHIFMKEPYKVKNQRGQDVLINQVGRDGLVLGRIDVHFEKSGLRKISSPGPSMI